MREAGRDDAAEHVGDGLEMTTFITNSSQRQNRKSDGEYEEQALIMDAVGTDMHKDTAAVRAKLTVYQKALEDLRIKERRQVQRKYSVAWSIFILCMLGVVGIVVVYLFTTDSESSDGQSLDTREICNSDNVQECLEGLQEQLKDDTTAALRVPSHYLFTSGAIFTTVVIYTWSNKRKSQKRQRQLNSLPHDTVDLWMSGSWSNRAEQLPFNIEIYQSIHNMLAKAVILKNVQQIVVEKRVAENRTECRDPNWGYVCLKDDGSKKGPAGSIKVNYKSHTASSYEYISSIAAKCNPAWQITPWETVREYITRLKKTCTGDRVRSGLPINPVKCDEFIALYEEARFHSADFNVEKWEQVRRNTNYFSRYFGPEGYAA
mmetsp:Transcript_15645/g.28683  ORF Transcript_15645/g.28683 Transcript_15645/m.28683 type:complete len:375 (+) Transcript_15645:462-1586(+)